MFIKQLIPMACLTAVLGFSAPSTAQITDAMKHAGEATVDAGKKVGSGVKHGTEKATSETKKVVTGAPKGATGKCVQGRHVYEVDHEERRLLEARRRRALVLTALPAGGAAGRRATQILLGQPGRQRQGIVRLPMME